MRPDRDRRRWGELAPLLAAACSLAAAIVLRSYAGRVEVRIAEREQLLAAMDRECFGDRPPSPELMCALTEIFGADLVVGDPAAAGGRLLFAGVRSTEPSGLVRPGRGESMAMVGR